jgi:hypothetical protein
MHRKRVEAAFKPIKPTSVRTDAGKASGWEDYQAERQEALDRMARQRADRLSSGDLKQRKIGPVTTEL